MHANGESYRTFLKPLIPAIFCCFALEKKWIHFIHKLKSAFKIDMDGTKLS